MAHRPHSSVSAIASDGGSGSGSGSGSSTSGDGDGGLDDSNGDGDGDLTSTSSETGDSTETSGGDGDGDGNLETGPPPTGPGTTGDGDGDGDGETGQGAVHEVCIDFEEAGLLCGNIEAQLGADVVACELFMNTADMQGGACLITTTDFWDCRAGVACPDFFAEDPIMLCDNSSGLSTACI